MSNRWTRLKKDIKKWGLRNSLCGTFKTASTSQILGNNECIEPFNAVYLRRVLSGEYIVINKYLIRDLIERKIWNVSIKNQIFDNGSIQNIEEIPKRSKENI